jgi:hypothetical protein
MDNISAMLDGVEAQLGLADCAATAQREVAQKCITAVVNAGVARGLYVVYGGEKGNLLEFFRAGEHGLACGIER